MTQTRFPGIPDRIRRCTRSVFALWLLGIATACAVHTPASINASSGAIAAPASIELLDMSDQTGLRSEFAQALSSSMQAHGAQVAEGGAAVADFSIGVRPAGAGLTGAGDSGAGEMQSPPRKPRWIDNCKAQRLRATLVLFDRASGSPIYRGEAETNDCQIGSQAIGDLAGVLVEDMLGR